MFSQVRRMVPATFAPFDTPTIQKFAEYKLLECAEIGSPRALQAQRAVADRLRRDAEDPAFRQRFGWQAAALENSTAGPLGFQIHQQKLAPELMEVLRENGLAWDPVAREYYDVRAEYIALHSNVGEVVMSILAIACAEGEGLDIVGDRRSGRLHRALMEKNSQAVYDAWLHPSGVPELPEKPIAPRGEDLFEFLLAFACNLKTLEPDKLAAMGGDREPLKRLAQRLRDAAAAMTPRDPGRPEQLRDFQDIAADLLAKWRDDRRNMSHYWAVFFGEGIAEPGERFLDKAAETLLAGGEKAAVGGGAAAAGHAAAAGAAASGTIAASLIGAGAGLAIGLLVHAGKAYYRMVGEEKHSPYRYLTLMEDAGVIFRSDLATPRKKTRHGWTWRRRGSHPEGYAAAPAT